MSTGRMNLGDTFCSDIPIPSELTLSEELYTLRI